MDAKELCKKFLDADKIINNEIEGNLTMYQIINDPEFDKCCDNQTCKTTKEIIGGLSAYLFMKARVLTTTVFETRVIENDDQYDEFFLMWLSDKLFKIVNEDDKSQINDITLYKAYEQHLKNNIVGSNYLDLLDKINGLKEVNLMHMKHFYKLLNPICKVITYYNPNDNDNNKIIDYSTECSNQYSSLYDSVYECISYLRLLDNLKNTYYSFINNVINKDETNEELAWKLKTLKTSDGKDDIFAKDFKEFDFNCSECKLETKLPPESSPTLQTLKQPPPQPQPQQGTPPQTSQMGDSDTGKKNTGGANGNKRDPNNPASSTLGRYFDWWSSFHESLFDRTEIFNKSFQFIDKGRQTVKEVTNKISDAYTNTVDIVKGAYDSTVNNIKDAYTISINYISDGFSSITNQLSSLSFFSQLGNDQSGSGSLWGGTDTSDQSQLKSPPPLPPPSTPQSTQQISQTSSSSQPQDTQQIPSPSQPQTNHTQDKLQSTVQSGASSTLHQPDPNTGTGVQTMTITHVTLPNSITDTPSIGNGSTTGTVVKTNEKSSIWYIAQNKKYDILGIGIISISIFAFLAIMYKYLSLGCTSKSKRKKNMKKVINSIGGKRPIQIIIKSYDRNKDLKPVINSVDRKKDPLLNIYKLMQADPIPFINLFFLLIFFVYKRQLNYLEL
ncbi:PIR protein CIR protein [Plasmodium vinckei brucechwatti]|uniref:PIR protein CIR protein n=1 Tax=Plasmodium vinckei brucechwatti TaxID=119398 RepID=A0A6V7SGS9_PLAVN|nr:PIR protein CIR protein [Plasmodium vinckei brucechwatti]